MTGKATAGTTGSGRARLWRRLAAGAYDLLLVFALLMVLTALVLMARGGAAIDPGSVWFQLLLVAGWWLYFGWSWTHGGQTVGMRAWRLVLVADDPAAVGWGRASLRFFGAFVSALAAGLGFGWSLVDPEGLCWHDRWSRTALEHRPKRSAEAQHRQRRDE